MGWLFLGTLVALGLGGGFLSACSDHGAVQLPWQSRPSIFLLAVFATMAVIAAIVMVVPKRKQGGE